MRILLCSLAALALGLPAAAADADQPGDDVAAVRKMVDSYVAAFNRGDAAAVADHWSEGGEWISPSGQRVRGREAIRKQTEAYFAEGGRPHIELIHPRIRLLAPTVAVEEGRALITRRGEESSETRYIAIHVRGDRGWRLDSVRETDIPAPPSNYPHLKQLQWMLGTWVDRDENGSVETTCHWTKNRNFLSRSFAVTIPGQAELEGTQVIGWDAANQQIRSWLFDSDGGFGEGTWQRDGNRWTITTSQTLPDGRRASSINVITRVNPDTLTWQSTGREVGGQLLPNIEPVTVVRKRAAQPADETADPNRNGGTDHE